MRNTVLFTLSLLLVLQANNLRSQHLPELKEIVYHLASDELRGRNTGDIGQKLAAGYMANYFMANKIPGIKETFDSVGYMQHFSLIRFSQQTRVLAIKNQDSLKLTTGVSFRPSKSYWNMDVSKAILFQTDSEEQLSIFSDTVANKGNPIIILLSQKLFARYLGQTGFQEFLLLDSLITGTFGRLKPLKSVPFFTLARKFSEPETRDVLILSYDEILSRSIATERKVKGKGMVVEFDPQVTLAVRGGLYINESRTENVVSIVPNKNKNAPWLIIGAHYDHIGISKKKVNYGADDNASGTAALMVLARHFAETGNQTNFNLMFIAFSGEERGLFGSKYFVNSPDLPKNTAAMINMDMIGRPDNPIFDKNYVYVRFSRSGKKLMKKPAKTSKVENLKIVTRPPFKERILYKFASDHFRFHRAGIPIAVLFTGLHDDYHTPADTPDKIEYKNMENIVVWLTKVISAMEAK